MFPHAHDELIAICARIRSLEKEDRDRWLKLAMNGEAVREKVMLELLGIGKIPR